MATINKGRTSGNKMRYVANYIRTKHEMLAVLSAYQAHSTRQPTGSTAKFVCPKQWSLA